MGFMSWITRDTKRSIPNKYSGRKTFPVYLIDNKGNKWCEKDYEGYGVFGGKNYFVLLTEMNGLGTGDEEKDRITGCFLVGRKGFIYPNLVENPNKAWKNKEPEICKFQGKYYN